jgi:hypothetical protein
VSANFFCPIGCLLHISRLDQNSEFLAAEPGDEFTGPKELTCARYERAERHITSSVSKCIIYTLEMVKVREEKCAAGQKAAV